MALIREFPWNPRTLRRRVMRSWHIDRTVFVDLSWWHWVLTIPLLTLHGASYRGALPVAVGLCGAVAAYFVVRLRQLRPFPVQVRLAYLSLLLVGMLPWMSWIHGVQWLGTTAMVMTGYCPLLRVLRLAPWNRAEPLTCELLYQVFLREACVGGLIRWTATTTSPQAACCSLRATVPPIR